MEHHRARVLVVDDDPKLGRLVARVLTSEHDVVVLTSAREALDIITGGERFDLVLCDLMLPGLSGMDFYERVRSIAPDLVERIVIITGGAYTAEALAFLERTSIACVDKPFSLDELRRTVRECLARLPSRRGDGGRGSTESKP